MTYIDPQVVPIIENMKNFRQERGSIVDVSPIQMRENFNNDTKKWNAKLPDIANVADSSIDLGSHKIPVRLYDPSPEIKQLPVMLFTHGGGWIVGDLDTNERFLRQLSIQAGIRILSIDYPLAPENPFPIALDCIVEIIKTIYDKCDDWGFDKDKFCLGGDSAGANLALSAALDLKDTNIHILKQITLIYGAFSPISDKPSFKKFGQGDYGMGAEAMEYFWGLYLQNPELKNNPRAVPLLAKVKGLPPINIITGGLDPLQDDSFELIEKLRNNDVKYSHFHYPGMVHGFISLCIMIDEGERAIKEMAEVLKNQLFSTLNHQAHDSC